LLLHQKFKRTEKKPRKNRDQRKKIEREAIEVGEAA